MRKRAVIELLREIEGANERDSDLSFRVNEALLTAVLARPASVHKRRFQADLSVKYPYWTEDVSACLSRANDELVRCELKSYADKGDRHGVRWRGIIYDASEPRPMEECDWCAATPALVLAAAWVAFLHKLDRRAVIVAS